MTDYTHCPKCGSALPDGHRPRDRFYECPTCGVIIEKYLQLEEKKRMAQEAEAVQETVEPTKPVAVRYYAKPRRAKFVVLLVCVVVAGYLARMMFLKQEVSDYSPVESGATLYFNPPYSNPGRAAFQKYSGTCISGMVDKDQETFELMEKYDNLQSSKQRRSFDRSMTKIQMQDPYNTLECIRQAADSPDRAERLALGRSLKKICARRDIGVADAYAVVSKLLKDEDPEVRLQAVRTLSMFGGKEPVGAAIKVLMSGDNTDQIPFNALNYLGQEKTPQAIDGLFQYLRNFHSLSESYFVFRVLEKIKTPEITKRLAEVMLETDKANSGFQARGLEAFLSMGDMAVPVLTSELLSNNSDYYLRKNIEKILHFDAERKALGLHGYQALVERLMNALCSKSCDTSMIEKIVTSSNPDFIVAGAMQVFQSMDRGQQDFGVHGLCDAFLTAVKQADAKGKIDELAGVISVNMERFPVETIIGFYTLSSDRLKEQSLAYLSDLVLEKGSIDTANHMLNCECSELVRVANAAAKKHKWLIIPSFR